MNRNYTQNSINLKEKKNTNDFTVSYYHVMYLFQSESTLYSYQSVKELLAQNRPDIWSLSDSNGIRTLSNLVRKWTLNYLHSFFHRNQ